MNLSVQDRLVLLNILPNEGDITTLRIVRELREDLSFSEAEHKILQLKQEGQRISWAEEVEKDVPMGLKAQALIAECLETLSKDKKLGLEHLPLYERFCEEEQDEVSKLRRRK